MSSTPENTTMFTAEQLASLEDVNKRVKNEAAAETFWDEPILPTDEELNFLEKKGAALENRIGGQLIFSKPESKGFWQRVRGGAYAAGNWMKRNPVTTAAIIAAVVFSGLVSGGIIPLAAIGLGTGGLFTGLVGKALAASIQAGFSTVANALPLMTFNATVGLAIGLGLNVGIMVAKKASSYLYEMCKSPMNKVQEEVEEYMSTRPTDPAVHSASPKRRT